MTQKVPMTLKGAEALRAELKRLKGKDRPNVIQAIAEARAHGDLSENAEYEAAKEQQGFIEGRIREVESKLACAEIIDPASLRGKRVVFGATVTVADVDTDEENTYQIVGEDEADLDEGKISVTSPMARAMIGKEPGDSVEVRAPGGVRAFEVVEVRYV